MRRCTLAEVARFQRRPPAPGRSLAARSIACIPTRARSRRAIALSRCRATVSTATPSCRRCGSTARSRRWFRIRILPDVPGGPRPRRSARTRWRRCNVSPRTYRQLLSVRTIGVTGSSGKTSTKELIAVRPAHALQDQGDRGQSQQSHRRAADADPARRGRRVRRGRDGHESSGRNRAAGAMAAPEIGVISSIGPGAYRIFCRPGRHRRGKSGAHRRACRPRALAVLNSDDEWSRRVADRTRARVVWIGIAAESTWRAEDLRSRRDRPDVSTRATAAESATVQLPCRQPRHGRPTRCSPPRSGANAG